MDHTLNDVYQEDAVACTNVTLLENGNVTGTEQLEPDILLSIKKEDLVCPYNLHISFCSRLQILPVYFLLCVHHLASCLTFIFGQKKQQLSHVYKHCTCTLIQYCPAPSAGSHWRRRHLRHSQFLCSMACCTLTSNVIRSPWIQNMLGAV
jgi:hypothetical protein